MNPPLTLTMEKPVYGGDSLARLSEVEGRSGKPVFVPLALPGETVTARIVEEKRGFDRAELETVLVPSPSRVAPRCPHFGVCGGCHYQHADYPRQLAMKLQVLRETLTRAGVAVPTEIATLAADPWAYRNRIRLAVTEAGEIGYRARRSHQTVPIQECPIAAPCLLAAAQALSALLRESTGPARISELEVFTDPPQSQLAITLFCDMEPAANAQNWLDALRDSFSSGPSSIRLQLAGGPLSPRVVAESGNPWLLYPAAAFPYRVGHGAFFQVNRWLIDEFVALAVGADSGGAAWDLYAGVGLFARQLASKFSHVTAVESAPASLSSLAANLEGTASQAVGAATHDFLLRNRQQREGRPDLIVLDPPRAGLGDQTTTLLNAIGAPALVYVSCDPATLARDLRALTRERYRIDSVTMADMFPQTFHIETVVRLSRS